MFTKVAITQPEPEVISLTEAKTHLNIIDFTDDDVYIQSLIPAALTLVEKGTGRLLRPATVTGQIEAREAREAPLFLPYPGNITVTSVQVDGSDIEYEYNDFSEILSITQTDLSLDDVVTVEYTTGYADGEVPTPLKQAALMILSELYENRQDTSGQTVNHIPLTSQRLMEAWKVNHV